MKLIYESAEYYIKITFRRARFSLDRIEYLCSFEQNQSV